MSSKAGDAGAGPAKHSVFRQRWSLGARLTLWYSGSAFVLVLAAASMLYWGLARGFEAEDDEALRERIRVIRALLENTHGDISELKKEIRSGWESLENPDLYIRILDESGRNLIETQGMAELLPPALLQRATADKPASSGVTVTSPLGKPFRVMSAPLRPDSPHPGRLIQVAVVFDADQNVLERYRRMLMAVLGTAALLSLGLGYGIARHGMEPVRELVAATRRVRSNTLDTRIQLNNPPAELLELSEHFNAMLGRLEDSFLRLSRFSADIAHELRTPLSNLRGEAEVALSRARTIEEYREVLSSSLEEYAALAGIIDSLLFIARSESPEAEIRTEVVNVAVELRGLADFYGALASERGVFLDVTSPPELEAALDRTLFQRAVSNLISNAIAYTPAGGRITLSASEGPKGVRVDVADTGQGIPPEHMPHVFERFYRVDAVRSRATGGAGLGLSIVRTAVSMHGGDVSLSSEPGRGTRVTLIFPNMTKS